MKLMEALESFKADAEAVRKSVTVNPDRVSEDIKQDELGYGRINNRRTNPQYIRALTECGRLIISTRKGISSDWKLKEAMSTSDFPLLFGDLMYRQLLGNYQVIEPTYKKIAQSFTVSDFRYLSLYTIDGGRAIPEAVAERAPYPELGFTEGRYQMKVGKFGRTFGISFEMVVNDDLNAFQSRPGELAVGFRMMEEKTVTSLWIDASGPHASFFTSGNKNKLASNAPLSHDAIQAIMTLMSRQTDSDGNPIVITGYELVVPPALEVTAGNLINALQLDIGIYPASGASTTRLTAVNWIKGKLGVTVNPWIPLIATTANGDTTWAIFARTGSGKPALAYAHLRGREGPQMFMKNPDAINLDGGMSSPMEGNFATDAIDYKARGFFGAIRIDPKSAYASNGSGVAD